MYDVRVEVVVRCADLVVARAGRGNGGDRRGARVKQISAR